MNCLESLKRFTIIAIDSGDIKHISSYTPHDATTNPSLIFDAVKLTSYQSLLKDAISYAKKVGGTKEKRVVNASDKLLVNIGTRILDFIPGLVSTEIDARLSFNSNMCIEKSHRLIALYQEQGISKSRVLIKIAATWEGIQAARELSKDGINCNLTLVFSLFQAIACAEAGVYLISPFIGRTYDWYIQRNLVNSYDIDKDPGILLVKEIYDYYKKNCYKTIIMGASFRKIEQILLLSGCDRLTISPYFLDVLDKKEGEIERKLFPPEEKCVNRSSLLSESEFRRQYNQNMMVMENLSEGIRQFTIDQRKLETFLSKYL